ncbi:MAG: hypothetical protein QXD89_00530 [Candidatus Aenigmatarchaeota archaeon]
MMREKIKNQFFIGLLVGFLIGFLIFTLIEFVLVYAHKNKIIENVRKLYEITNPGSKVEIEGIKEEKNLYKLLLKVTTMQRINYLETYVTKDGKFLSGNVIPIEENLQQIEKMKKFVDCLFNKNVRIFGATSTNITQINSATLLQLSILGIYSGKIYVSCDGDALQQCINIGLTSLPALVYENKAYYGVYTAEFIANLTGCKL